LVLVALGMRCDNMALDFRQTLGVPDKKCLKVIPLRL
jgi:hypothetical protein